MGLRDLPRRLVPRRTARPADDRIVWIVGSPRSGTTWLLNQLCRATGAVKLDEPGIGVHLGLFLHEFFGAPASNFPPERSLMTQLRAQDGDYFFAEAYRHAWLPQLRELLLARFGAQGSAAGGRLCLVKEPNGSQALPLLLEALPASRVIWLLRDGRDAVDSELDGTRPGGWMARYGATWEMSPEARLRFVEDRAVRWLRRTEYVQGAFARLEERQRLLLRYEELLADTPAHLERALGWLGHPPAAGEAADIAARFAFEKMPVTGEGQFARAARPGGWRENLDPDEHAAMEAVMGAKLRELGYD